MEAVKKSQRRSRRPDLRGRAQIASGGVLAALIAAEAAAEERVETGVDDDGSTPVAASLEDILNFAEICEARARFGAFGAGHGHDRFIPRFAHVARGAHEDASPAAGSDHHALGLDAESGAHSSAHGSHRSAPRMGSHGGHDGLTIASDAEHGQDANEAHEFADLHVHDLDADLAALIASTHAGRVAHAPGDPRLAAVNPSTNESASAAAHAAGDETEAPAAPMPTGVAIAAASPPATHHHHDGDDAPLTPVIVTVEI